MRAWLTWRTVAAAGVRDDGYPEGMSDEEFRESLKTLRSMAQGVSASIKSVKVTRGVSGKLAEVVLRRDESRWVATR
jgi:GTPase